MNSVLLSPTSLPSAISSSSFDPLLSSISPSSSPSNSSASSPPISSHQLDEATSPPSNSSAPPPQTQSPPPVSPFTPPPTSPSPPEAPPPTLPPPSPLAAPPPSVASPPLPILTPSPPSGGSPAPQASPSPPVTTPEPPQAISPSPPPPANVPSPPSKGANSPKSSPPPSSNSPSTPATTSPPPPSAFSPSTAPSNSTSRSPSTTVEKPTAKSTNGTTLSRKSDSAGSGGLKTGGAVALGIVAAFAVLGFLVMAVWFTQKRRKRNAGIHDVYTTPSPFPSSQGSESAFLRPYFPAHLLRKGSQSDLAYSPSEPGGINSSRSWFTLNELVQATNGLSEKNLLGEGGFGCVYKGVLSDGREVAVKQLKIGGGQGEREFRAEVEIIGRVHHRHLVSLVGYCISDHHRLLVYDYLPNDTLHYHLHGKPWF